VTELRTWCRTVWSTLIAARQEILLWAAYAAVIAGVFQLLTNNNAWRGEMLLASAALLFLSRWMLRHDEQISKLTVAGTAEQLFRESVVAHQARMEREIAMLRSQLDIHIRSTSAPARIPPRPTPHKR
jgi:hypothetical protein